ncbi:MAG: hypothetical protein EBV03_05985, partial [Proteobacteria bacterium]|nr:hypothetical protein [Pseudomonadota bacterium]
RHDHFLPFPDTQPVPAVTVTRSFRGFKSEDGAPVFIVQLESLNALALAGLATREEGLGPEQLMPQMYAAREKGVLVTHMWGASMQTQRGQGAILCSGVMDMGGGIASLPKLQSACLPAMLKADGYTTFFASAYSDGQFHNTDRLLAQMGFSERHFADKIQPGDKKWRWGADDCVFYDRYFDYFDAHPELTQSHFMAYLTVSAHHDPFYSREKYADIAPLTQGRGFLADYLNSAAAQDHCLKRFLERVEPYRQRAHVIVVGDHSWPVGLNGSTYNERGATSDNFMTPFLYLPPYDKGDAMRRGALVDTPALGQPDIFPTVLELLSGTPYRNSFAALLRQGKDGAPPALPDDYDDCQVVTQPYDGTHMGVVRGKHKVTFSVMRRRLATSRLGDDFYEFAPLEAQGNVDFGDFLNQHMCERYKYWLEPDAAAPDFAVPNLQPQ